ncbi:hypothetical protein QWY75_03090 [Pontixanthobacter aestiaquae]|uniref:Uncharacterized protein n=1 Tax=Pontixanthobacter aestiaquae TaxID=1509367 RepID=A0A844ZAB6_9SPHN|nr:hypothetical protein [Pontixanthobacter aestiaquae]MDN3645190.1 hypothetical protein [Pontixanthobacter aestiaquae]MXO83810.1 hypothetical protein [Pontixanthobacter aestiaquae]
MMKAGLSVLGAGMLLFAAPVLAAENIECSLTGYSDEQQKVLDTYQSGFTTKGLEDLERQAPMIDAVSDRILVCAEQHSWSDEAADAAFYYATTVIDERALRAFSPSASSVVDRVDSELTAGERDRVWKIIGAASDVEATENEQGMNDEDVLFLGAILLKLDPESDDETIESVGALLAMVSARRVALAEFATL